MRPPSRIPRDLSESLHHRLNLYALAASAAGVSFLAFAEPSAAEVVYTKTHQVIGTNGVYGLDLNHDGVIDFLIQQWGGFGSSSIRSNGLLAKEALGNAVQGKVAKRYFATALKAGAQVGPQQRFIAGGYNGEVMASLTHCCTTGSDNLIGYWVDVKNRYLGLRFKINGKVHYGWARLTVQVQQFQMTAALTGYAYETIAGKSIQAGQTAGAAGDTPVGLGRLALGATGAATKGQPW